MQLKDPRGALVRLSVWGVDSMRLNRRYATSDTSQNSSGFSVHAVVFWEFLTANDNPLATVRTMGVIIMAANGAELFLDCLQTCFYITTRNENCVILVIMHVLLFLSNFMFPLIIHVPECEHWISNIIWISFKGLFLKLAKTYYRLRLWHLGWLWRFPDVLMLSHALFLEGSDETSQIQMTYSCWMLIEITQSFILSEKFLLVNALSYDKPLLNTCPDLRGFLKVNSCQLHAFCLWAKTLG